MAASIDGYADGGRRTYGIPAARWRTWNRKDKEAGNKLGIPYKQTEPSQESADESGVLGL